MRYCFDIETDGFLDTATKVHCIILKDIDTKQILHLNNEEAVKKLEQAELIIGHNIIKFDIPVLKKFYNLKSRASLLDRTVPPVARKDLLTTLSLIGKPILT